MEGNLCLGSLYHLYLVASMCCVFICLFLIKAHSAFIGRVPGLEIRMWTSLGTIILLTAEMLRGFPAISPEPPLHCTSAATLNNVPAGPIRLGLHSGVGGAVSPALWGCETGHEQEQTGSQGDVFVPSQRVEAGWTSPQGDLNLHPRPSWLRLG